MFYLGGDKHLGSGEKELPTPAFVHIEHRLLLVCCIHVYMYMKITCAVPKKESINPPLLFWLLALIRMCMHMFSTYLHVYIYVDTIFTEVTTCTCAVHEHVHVCVSLELKSAKKL